MLNPEILSGFENAGRLNKNRYSRRRLPDRIARLHFE
jgi:hypothetical protein